MIFGYHAFEGAYEVPMRVVGANIYYEWIIYLLVPLVFGFLFYGVYRRIRIYMIGQNINRFDHLLRRIGFLIWNVISQKQVLRRKIIGIFHFILFWGFIIMFLSTCCFAAWNVMGFPPMTGYLYIGVSMLADLAGFGAIIAVLVFLINRLILKPRALSDTTWADNLMLIFLCVILLTGFPLEAIRISVQMNHEMLTQGTLAALSYERWASPIGYPLAWFFFHQGFAVAVMEEVHRFLWWFHMFLGLSMVALIPYSKLWHIFASLGQYFFRDFGVSAARMVYNIEEAESFGVENIEQFTWKDLADLDACIRCGRCQEECPAFNTGKRLNPKMAVIQTMKRHLDDKKEYLLAQKDYRLRHEKFPNDPEFDDSVALESLMTQEAGEANPLETSLIYDVVGTDVIWSCTNCRACVEACPMFIEHVDKITEMRRNLVMWQGDMLSEAQSAFTNMERNYNPWGVGWAKRAEWLEERKIREKVNLLGEDGEPFEYLFFGGCAVAFDDRFKKVGEALVRVLEQAGIKLAYLGTEEMCCGDSARRLGNEYLYQTLAAQNIETFKSYGAKKIVVLCPHGYNTLKNEYPQMGGEFEVIHYTELLDSLIKSGKLKLDNKTQLKVSYHDSCFLGRHNGIYNQPRRIIAAAGGKINEVQRSQAKGFCCGAGGGRMWLEEHAEEGFKRINETRTDQLLVSKPDAIMTNCPFCLTMIDDGVKASGQEENVRVIDLVEFLWQTIKPYEASPEPIVETTNEPEADAAEVAVSDE